MNYIITVSQTDLYAYTYCYGVLMIYPHCKHYICIQWQLAGRENGTMLVAGTEH